VVCVVLGLILAGAMLIGGESLGVAGAALAVMVVYGAVLYAFSPRSEVFSLLSGEARDERQRSINDRASAASFAVLVVVFVGAFVVTTALGSDLSMVFADLSAFAGLTWVTALIVLTRRG
jgi:hypothetical protein